MPRLNILSTSEQQEFDNPPILSGETRKLYFKSGHAVKDLISQMTDTNKVGFLLMLYYFKISKKFFLPKNLHRKDFEYVERQLGYANVNFRNINLGKDNFKRYKQKILEYIGFKGFDLSAKQLLYDKSYHLSSVHVKPKVIFNDCVELLLNQKIEIPKYSAISGIIVSAVRDYKYSILKLLASSLSDEHKLLLDDLFSLVDNKSYKLTTLKSYNHSTKPKAIRENVAELNNLRKIYDKLLPLIKILPLNTRGIEYFATTVLKSDIFRIKRKTDTDKYLHLITFIIYQYSILHDALTDILLKSVSSFNSSSKREHQNRCYEYSTKHAASINNYISSHHTQREALNNIYNLCQDHTKDSDTKCKKIEEILQQLFTTEKQDNQDLLITKSIYTTSGYYETLSDKSRSLQSKLSPILNVLRFDEEKSSATETLKAIEFFQKTNGKLSPSPPINFLNPEEKTAVISNNKINTSLYKALLFRKVSSNIKAGSLNLISSYRFRALDEYLIASEEWKTNKDALIKQAGLENFVDIEQVLIRLEEILNKEYIKTNENIISESNKYIKINKINNYVINTPAIINDEGAEAECCLSDYFPNAYTVPMQEVLFTVNKLCEFSKCFNYFRTSHSRELQDKLLVAGIMSLGYGMGDNEIASISKDISPSALENTVNCYFTVENIQNAIDTVLRLTNSTLIPDLYLEKNQKIHTSSDGQKWKTVYDSLNAAYSFKYYGQGQGVTVASFMDKRYLLFYSTVMSTSIREAAYVIDGLMHNDVVKSDIHSTDSHGYSEVVFAITHFLAIFMAPRIKGIKHQVLSTFTGYRAKYRDNKYKIIPTHTINKKIIKEHNDDILRFIVTIKLKRSTASQLLSRLNSYSKQHKLYQALKEFGKIIKSIFRRLKITSINREAAQLNRE